MKYLVEIEASSCNDCIFCRKVQDMSATLHVCSHKGAPKGYEAVIEKDMEWNLKTPGWCPLRRQIPVSDDPVVPCMKCKTGKMVYTGEVITTSQGIPVLRCVKCGARAELTFDFFDREPGPMNLPWLKIRHNPLLPTDVVEVRTDEGKIVGTIKLG